jgi:hypothetical protein
MGGGSCCGGGRAAVTEFHKVWTRIVNRRIRVHHYVFGTADTLGFFCLDCCCGNSLPVQGSKRRCQAVPSHIEASGSGASKGCPSQSWSLSPDKTNFRKFSPRLLLFLSTVLKNDHNASPVYQPVSPSLNTLNSSQFNKQFYHGLRKQRLQPWWCCWRPCLLQLWVFSSTPAARKFDLHRTCPSPPLLPSLHRLSLHLFIVVLFLVS